jgi:hypothetical protein
LIGDLERSLVSQMKMEEKRRLLYKINWLQKTKFIHGRIGRESNIRIKKFIKNPMYFTEDKIH